EVNSEVNADGAQTAPLSQRKSPPQPGHRRRHQEPEPHPHHPRHQMVPPGIGIAGQDLLDDSLAEQEKTQRGPDQKQDRVQAEGALGAGSNGTTHSFSQAGGGHPPVLTNRPNGVTNGRVRYTLAGVSSMGITRRDLFVLPAAAATASLFAADDTVP